MPDDAAVPSGQNETRPRAHWRQTDVKRAINAAEKAGLRAYRIEIGPDGTISIVVGLPPETADASDSA